LRLRISVIIPVYCETSTINGTIANLQAQTQSEPVEIIVVDGDTSASTLKSIRHPDVVKLKAARGRASQMNRGAEKASGDILLFLHADTRLPHGGIDRIRQRMSGVEKTVAGAFDLGIASKGWAFRVIEAVVHIRTRLTKIPYGDQAIFIKKRFFGNIGGFKEIPIMEDVELMGRIKRGGRTIHIVPEKVHTSPRRWVKEGILRCTLRNWMIMTLYLARVRPERLARFYR
jgi:rSAM/selenodomain-associated transferase 2